MCEMFSQHGKVIKSVTAFNGPKLCVCIAVKLSYKSEVLYMNTERLMLTEIEI